MEYEIYVMSYIFGAFPGDAAVSTTSHDRARELLEELLEEWALSVGITKKINLEVMESYQIGVRTDTERVIIPSEEVFSRARGGDMGTREVH